MNKTERYEQLIMKQGAYLQKLGEMIRGKETRKELVKFVDKYGIGK